MNVSLGPAQYLGDHPELGGQRSGELVFCSEWIGFSAPGSAQPDGPSLPMSATASVRVRLGETAKTAWSHVALDIALVTLSGGPPDAPFKVSKQAQRVEVAVHSKSGDVATFAVPKKSVAETCAAIAPLLRAAEIPLLRSKAQPKSRR
jgi:hypothetical protein